MTDGHISSELNLKAPQHQATLNCSTMPYMASVSQVEKNQKQNKA